ncbi:MAG TPA: hypothetical protein VHV51_06205 [Polyangiaceae bacterium]|jgi:hypothetical protein|nr:hypothetical protein [Polyangiaceae bacterium]
MVDSRALLLARLSDIAYRLQLLSRAGRAEPHAFDLAFAELVTTARELDVPTHEPRDDAAVFIADPHKIVGATWTQCGGILHELEKERGDDAAFLVSEVAARLLRIAPTHR